MKLETEEDVLQYYWYFLYDLHTGMKMNVKNALEMADLQKGLASYRNSQRMFIRAMRICEGRLADDTTPNVRTTERILEVLTLLVDCHSEMQAKIRRAYKKNEGKLGTPRKLQKQKLLTRSGA